MEQQPFNVEVGDGHAIAEQQPDAVFVRWALPLFGSWTSTRNAWE